MAQLCYPQLFLASGEAGQLGKRLYSTAKKWLQPRQATMKAAECSKTADCVLPRRDKQATCVLPDGKNYQVHNYWTCYCHVQFFALCCFKHRSFKGHSGCGSPGHVPSPWDSKWKRLKDFLTRWFAAFNLGSIRSSISSFPQRRTTIGR